MTEYVVTVSFPTAVYTVDAENEDEAIMATDALIVADVEAGLCTYNVYPEVAA